MSKAKNNISVKAQIPSMDSPIDIESFEKQVEEGKKIEEAVNPAIVASMVDYPITIKYGDSSIRISGRARLEVGDFEKLPKLLPSGIVAKKK